ncbi:hypothetical protein ACWA2B_10470 [Paenibacillus sp. CMM36]
MTEQINERLDHIEFKQELLFQDTMFDHVLFEANCTRSQRTDLFNLLDNLDTKLQSGEKVSHITFETKVNDIFESERDYHFAENIAMSLYDTGRYQELVFQLYKDLPKFNHKFL